MATKDLINKLWLTLLYTWIILIIFCVADSLIFDDRLTLHISTRPDCDFVVPKGYVIVTDGKMYAVRVTKFYEDEYLWKLGSGISTMSSSIDTPSLFYSECKAKGYLKKYLKQIEPMDKKFVEVKK